MVLRHYDLTDSELDVVRRLFVDKQALNELIQSVSQNDVLYTKLKGEFIDASVKLQQWFIDFQRLKLDAGEPGCIWDVDFINKQVLLRNAEDLNVTRI